MGMTRGITAKVLREFILQEHGEEGLERLVEQLPPEQRKHLNSPYTLQWTEIEFSVGVIEAIARAFGRNPQEIARQVGAFSAGNTIGTFYRFLLSTAAPATIVEKFPSLWKTYSNTGEVAECQVEGNRGALVLTGFTDAGLSCHTLCGFVQKALEMAGARNVQVNHTECAAHGGAKCRFQMTWS